MEEVVKVKPKRKRGKPIKSVDKGMNVKKKWPQILANKRECFGVTRSGGLAPPTICVKIPM